MEKKNDKEHPIMDAIGCGFSSLIGLCIYGGISLLMFWLCVKCTGNNMEDIFR